MRTKVKKIFWMWNFEEEEKWLNQMSAKGLHLVSVGICNYTFEEGIEGAYTIQTELLEHFDDHPESRKYLAFIEETGAEYLGSVKANAYFRKEKSKGEFHLHSNIAPRLSLIHRVRILCLIGFIVEMFFTVPNIIIFIGDMTMVFNGMVSLLGLLLSGLFMHGFVKLTRTKVRLKKKYDLYEAT